MQITSYINFLNQQEEILNELNSNTNSLGVMIQIEESNLIGYQNQLDNFLSLVNTKKKIIFNFLPLKDDTTMNYEQKKINREVYIGKFYNILSKYQYLSLYLCSSEFHFLFLFREWGFGKIGLVIEENNYNYLDVDFYVLPTSRLDINIITEQLSLNKEIMIEISNEQELVLVRNFLLQYSGVKALNEVQFIISDKFYQIMKNNQNYAL